MNESTPHTDLELLQLHDLISADATLEEVSSGGLWFEGPVWIPERGRLRWSDIPADRILEYDVEAGATSVYALQVEFTNGRTLDVDGSVVQCSHGRRRVERDRGGVVTTVADAWNGVRLNSPNDVVIGPDGAIWFTDPAYGITEAREGHPGEREYGDHWVFRVDPRTGRATPVVVDVEEPNGLAFSPDGLLLYVADSSAVRRPPGVGNHHIRVYDVRGGTRCKNGRTFAVVDTGFADGIAVDDLGNVWSSSESGVIVFGPEGRALGRLPVPQLVGNLCFGGRDGRDLWIAASTSIYRIRTRRHDAWQGRARG